MSWVVFGVAADDVGGYQHSGLLYALPGDADGLGVFNGDSYGFLGGQEPAQFLLGETSGVTADVAGVVGQCLLKVQGDGVEGFIKHCGSPCLAPIYR